MLNYSEIGILVSADVQQLDVFHCELKRCFDSECHLETLLRIYIHPQTKGLEGRYSLQPSLKEQKPLKSVLHG